jgi:hypothetical protein
MNDNKQQARRMLLLLPQAISPAFVWQLPPHFTDFADLGNV